MAGVGGGGSLGGAVDCAADPLVSDKVASAGFAPAVRALQQVKEHDNWMKKTAGALVVVFLLLGVGGLGAPLLAEDGAGGEPTQELRTVHYQYGAPADVQPYSSHGVAGAQLSAPARALSTTGLHARQAALDCKKLRLLLGGHDHGSHLADGMDQWALCEDPRFAARCSTQCKRLKRRWNVCKKNIRSDLGMGCPASSQQRGCLRPPRQAGAGTDALAVV